MSTKPPPDYKYYDDPEHVNTCAINNPLKLPNAAAWRVRKALSCILTIAQTLPKNPRPYKEKMADTAARNAIKALRELVPGFIPISKKRRDLLQRNAA